MRIGHSDKKPSIVSGLNTNSNFFAFSLEGCFKSPCLFVKSVGHTSSQRINEALSILFPGGVIENYRAGSLNPQPKRERPR